MQVKRFVAKNMRLALKQVREEMGPEAVILSNKRVPEGVEILTAIDPADMPASNADSMQASESRSAGTNPFEEAVRETASGGGAKPAAKPSKLELEVERMQREAKQRAEALAEMLSAKSKRQLEQVLATEQAELPGIAAEELKLTGLDSATIDAALAPDTADFGSIAKQSVAAEGSFSAQLKSLAATQAPQRHAADHQSADESLFAANSETQEDLLASKLAQQQTPAETAAVHSSDDFDRAFSQAANRAADTDRELTQMRFELQSMRDLLQHQLSHMSWGQYSQLNPEEVCFRKRLKRMGITEQLTRELLTMLPGQQHPACQNSSVANWQTLMLALCQRLPVTKSDLIDQGGCFAFVGPTGAGKTTTIGKLATRYVLKHGAENVALVTTDTMRIAAYEQLRTFSRILNVPLKIVDKHNSLERVLYALRHKSLVLIDTAGLNRQDKRLSQQLNSLNELGARLQTVMVLPATSQPQVLSAAVQTYRTDNLSACALTKLDETASLGEVLSLLMAQQLPVAYTSNGQAIPDDIELGNAKALLKEAIELAKPVAIDEESMVEDYALAGKDVADMPMRNFA